MTNLTQLLDRLGEARDGSHEVTLGRIVEAVGRRSFGPLLLVAGLVPLSPLSGIPGVPTATGLLVLLIAGQLLLGRRHFWLPRWLLDRTVPRARFDAALRLLRRPARAVDRLVRPRWAPLTSNGGVYLIAAVCLAIAVAMPPMELLPFTASVAGGALATLGLALIAHDGVLALLSMVLTVATFTAVAFHLL